MNKKNSTTTIQAKYSGFTLIEVLVAVAIFAIMGTIATLALKRIFIHKQILSQHIQEMNQLQMAVTMLRLDISQMIDRPVRDKKGSIEQSVTGSSSQITFTRTGNVNPLGYFNISHLQRISYSGGGVLNRAAWPVLDNAPQTKSSNRELLKDVSNWKLTYLNEQLERYSSWPARNANKSTNSEEKPNPIPTAVEVEFNYKNQGLITVLIPIYAANLHAEKDIGSDNEKKTEKK